MSEDYRVQLDVFTGPLDLLLYLIRRNELDIHDISVAKVADQYLEYATMLEALDPNSAGEFLVLAATLIEIKSRALLPTPPIEDMDDDEDDPRATLVKELLEYKRFKDASKSLGSAADERAKRYVRVPVNLPKEMKGVELEDVELWDLVKAFGNVMSSIGQGPMTHDVTKDDHPIEYWANHLVDKLSREKPMHFHEAFDETTSRAQKVGMFLALLELLRNQRIRIEQDRNFSVILIFLLVEATEALVRIQPHIVDEDADADETDKADALPEETEATDDESPNTETELINEQAERESD